MFLLPIPTAQHFFPVILVEEEEEEEEEKHWLCNPDPLLLLLLPFPLSFPLFFAMLPVRCHQPATKFSDCSSRRQFHHVFHPSWLLFSHPFPFPTSSDGAAMPPSSSQIYSTNFLEEEKKVDPRS